MSSTIPDSNNKRNSSDTEILFQVIGTGCSIYLVERYGRKILLIISSAGMFVAISSLGLFFALDEHREVICGLDAEPGCVSEDGISDETMESISWLPLTSLILYKFFFSIGYGPLPWVMNGEFFPLEAKGLSSSIATAFNWFCAFLVSKFGVDIEMAVGTSGTYFLYGSVCFVATFFVFFVVPETRGKSAEDMKKYFSK